MQNKLKLLDASVRHLGTDINYVVLENLYNELKEKADFHFDTPVVSINRTDNGYLIKTASDEFECKTVSYPWAEAAVNGWKNMS